MDTPDDILLAALERVAPGTRLREALDHIIAAATGALVVIGDEPTVEKLCNGGFVLNTPFTPQRLFELAKMDGAIILDTDNHTILKANVHLVLDTTLPTSETGMRHRTAERVSRQTSALVVAVSRRRDLVSLYMLGEKITLEDIEVVLAKANQALQTLQRFRTRLDAASGRLTTLELEDAVTIGNVTDVLQSQLMVQRVAHEVDRYVTELGTEGRLVRLQADELTAGVDAEHMTLLRDYVVEPGLKRATGVRSMLEQVKGDELLDDAGLAQALGLGTSPDALEYHVQSRGYRVLRRIPSVPDAIASRLVEHFGTLAGLLQASESQLDDVEGVGARRARAVRDGLRRIRQHASF